MTPEARGVYRELLDALWGEKDCSLPADDDTLAGLAGVTREYWLTVRAQVLAWFDEVNGRLTNPRALYEWKKARGFRSAKRKAGRDGAKARWDKKKETTADDKQKHGTAIGSPLAKDASPSPSAVILHPSAGGVGTGITIPPFDGSPLNLAIVGACREISRLTGKEETEVLKAHSMIPPRREGERPTWIVNLDTASEPWRLRTHQDLQAELSRVKAPPEDENESGGLLTMAGLERQRQGA